MNLVEVLERRRQLRQDGSGIAEVHAADVIALERVDEASMGLIVRSAGGQDCATNARPSKDACVLVSTNNGPCAMGNARP